MQPTRLFLPIFLSLYLLLLSRCEADATEDYEECVSFQYYRCGETTYNISFPFRLPELMPDYCGSEGYDLACVSNETLMINISSKSYQVKSIDYTAQVLTVVDPDFASDDQSCQQYFTGATIDSPLFTYIAFDLNLTFFNCSSAFSSPSLFPVNCTGFGPNNYYYSVNATPTSSGGFLRNCRTGGAFTINQTAWNLLEAGSMNIGNVLQGGFSMNWTAGNGWCSGCQSSGGMCGNAPSNSSAPNCLCPNGTVSSGDRCNTQGNTSEKSHLGTKIGIGIGAGVGGVLVISFICLLVYKQKKRKQTPPTTAHQLIQTTSSRQSFREDRELNSVQYRTHIFSYEELEEATDGFNASKELGDGGFGIVYKGKLRDGRTVAVKRLYENNYKRVEQFMNEVDILSRLRHQNLVTLYGCTSRNSRELLLVYEYVPNGTVADHLHGSLADKRAPMWSVRLNIAIEAADALAYLHAIEPQIIHRDVKTNNILLDNSFRVKVADFGLSRLFPLDATHVSTAPQGTPGYVDPEYYQCYQLTDKSDVYSFGVVLLELISSRPAVDINRSRNEVNLASFAVSKIQSNELDQLVDPELGQQADWETKKMISQVAELAFRCLRSERDMRPPMKEVLEVLRGIQDGSNSAGNVDKGATAQEEAHLLRKNPPYSPNSVTDRWMSKSTTPNNSA